MKLKSILLPRPLSKFTMALISVYYHKGRLELMALYTMFHLTNFGGHAMLSI